MLHPAGVFTPCFWLIHVCDVKFIHSVEFHTLSTVDWVLYLKVRGSNLEPPCIEVLCSICEKSFALLVTFHLALKNDRLTSREKSEQKCIKRSTIVSWRDLRPSNWMRKQILVPIKTMSRRNVEKNRKDGSGQN